MANIAKGNLSKTGTLRKVLVCPPTHFRVTVPINAVQWLYRCDGHVPPSTPLIVDQHSHLIDTLIEEGVDVESIPPAYGLPYQHSTRNIGVADGINSISQKNRTLHLYLDETLSVSENYSVNEPMVQLGYESDFL